MIDFSLKKNKRNPDKIKSLLVEDGDCMFLKDKLYIVFPEKYIHKNLAIIDEEITIAGYFTMYDGKGNYANFSLPTIIKLGTGEITEVVINKTDYVCIEYEKDDIFIANLNVVVTEAILYPIFNEFCMQGKVPFSFTPEDLGNIFLYAKEYTGGHIGNEPLAMELISSVIAKMKNDKTVDFRFDTSKEATYVGLLNVFYAVTSNLNKITGAYGELGMLSAVNDDSTNSASEVEKILLK